MCMDVTIGDCWLHGWLGVPGAGGSKAGVTNSAVNDQSVKLYNHGEGPYYTRAFSWLKAALTAFTFKTILRHYAKPLLICAS